jgi:hypothetical protein
MIAYLSGKITGDSEYRAKFEKYQKVYEACGMYETVISPAMLPEGLRRESYMPICFELIKAADVVIMLPDWKDSPGAKLEKAFAEYQKKPVIFCGYE